MKYERCPLQKNEKRAGDKNKTASHLFAVQFPFDDSDVNYLIKYVTRTNKNIKRNQKKNIFKRDAIWIKRDCNTENRLKKYIISAYMRRLYAFQGLPGDLFYTLH